MVEVVEVGRVLLGLAEVVGPALVELAELVEADVKVPVELAEVDETEEVEVPVELAEVDETEEVEVVEMESLELVKLEDVELAEVIIVLLVVADVCEASVSVELEVCEEFGLVWLSTGLAVAVMLYILRRFPAPQYSDPLPGHGKLQSD